MFFTVFEISEHILYSVWNRGT